VIVPPPPAGLRWAALFFAVSGMLELVLAPFDGPGATAPLPLWEALGRALLHWLLAAALLARLALARWLALVYCLAALATYAFVLAMALAGAPVRFPPSVIVQSLVQVPSCALLLPWLRSSAAAQVLSRPLSGR
jgi:hypothetical protein